MGHIDGKQTDGHRESAEDIVEIYDRDGAAIRYRRDDFDEIYATVETAEMRRLVSLGWLILDQRINREPGKSAPWIDTALRRFAGRVLPAQDDPEFRPPSDRTTYVLGHLKAGVKGTRVS